MQSSAVDLPSCYSPAAAASRRRGQRPGHHDKVPATHSERRCGQRLGYHGQVPATRNERHRGQRPRHHDQVSATHTQHHFCEIVTLCRRSPHQDWGRARTAGSRVARNDYTVQTEHTSPQPSRSVRRKCAALLSGAEEQTSRVISAHAQCACLLSLQMGTVNYTRLD